MTRYTWNKDDPRCQGEYSRVNLVEISKINKTQDTVFFGTISFDEKTRDVSAGGPAVTIHLHHTKSQTHYQERIGGINPDGIIWEPSKQSSLKTA